MVLFVLVGDSCKESANYSSDESQEQDASLVHVSSSNLDYRDAERIADCNHSDRCTNELGSITQLVKVGV